jgi:hypothetical protein
MVRHTLGLLCYLRLIVVLVHPANALREVPRERYGRLLDDDVLGDEPASRGLGDGSARRRGDRAQCYTTDGLPGESWSVPLEGGQL